MGIFSKKSEKKTKKLKKSDEVFAGKPLDYKKYKKVNALNIAFSIRHLSIMLKSGLALEAALKILVDQTNDKKLQKVLLVILNDVREGVSISESMKKFPQIFSNIIISIISTGEQGGTLEKNLIFLADYLKQAHELEKKIKNAMIYPLIVLGLTVTEMLGVIFFILPKLESLFTAFKNIPEFTKFVLAMSKTIRDNNGTIVAVLIVIFIALSKYLGTNNGKIFKDKFNLRFPVLKNLNRSNILATFSRTVSILLENGIPIARALEISAETISNYEYSKILQAVHEKVKGGQNLGISLGEYPKYFPDTYTKMVDIGEETGSLEENLLYLYEFYAEEVDDMSNNLTTLLEPVMLVFIGVMIGGLAIMIVGPIYELMSTINN